MIVNSVVVIGLILPVISLLRLFKISRTLEYRKNLPIDEIVENISRLGKLSVINSIIGYIVIVLFVILIVNISVG